MRLSDLNRIVGGIRQGPDAHFGAVSIDTRTLEPGSLFIAIRGPRFDGHDFVHEAQAAGAAAALLEREVDCALPGVLVSDTRRALGRLAMEWRSRADVRVVGVTGSNGKTTVKEMIAAILAVDAPVLSTRGNLNNDLGVPLTLLAIKSGHRYAVIEMGANRPGEIRYVAEIARPQVGLVTNAGPAHLEGFGSLEGVARAKGELYAALAADGVAILNADDPYFELWKSLAGRRRVVTFGFSRDADIHAPVESIAMRLENGGFATRFAICAGGRSYPLKLALAGRHNVMNALAATAAGLTLGIDLQAIQAGLGSLAPVPGRLQPVRGRSASLLINDTYNANPSSFEAGLEVLTQLEGERWIVLGAFGELGQDSAALHTGLGHRAKAIGAHRLFATGPDTEKTVRAFGSGAQYFAAQEALIEAVAAGLHKDAVVLIKGSRSQHMERVVEALCYREEGRACC
jgi:UDP-N-acetylmuramoyl-tripeptide--D-alanyl-D-alanine ligase